MPRKDQIHEAVRNALIKDGWTITDDPYRIEYEEADVYADLRPEEQLYLAIDKASYDPLFARRSFQQIVEDYRLALLVVDLPNEEIAQWID
jgi:hypothetical protein